MSEKVGPALFAKWDAKLYNWALCGYAKGIQRAGVKERKVYKDAEHWTFYVDRKNGKAGKAGKAGQAETWETEAPPGFSIEGKDTDALVVQLSDDLRTAVEAYWALTGPMEYRASAIGCHLSTLYRRIDEAVVELERMDGARKRGERASAAKQNAGTVVRRTQFVPENQDA